ncbi:unnamed protein product [Phaeothamnion confervicola]
MNKSGGSGARSRPSKSKESSRAKGSSRQKGGGDRGKKSDVAAKVSAAAAAFANARLATLRELHWSELAYLLDEFSKLEASLGPDVKAGGDAESQEKLARLQQFIEHLRSTMERLDARGDAAAAMSPQQIRDLDEHIRERLMPVKDRLVAQMAANAAAEGGGVASASEAEAGGPAAASTAAAAAAAPTAESRWVGSGLALAGPAPSCADSAADLIGLVGCDDCDGGGDEDYPAYGDDAVGLDLDAFVIGDGVDTMAPAATDLLAAVGTTSGANGRTSGVSTAAAAALGGESAAEAALEVSLGLSLGLEVGVDVDVDVDGGGGEFGPSFSDGGMASATTCQTDDSDELFSVHDDEPLLPSRGASSSGVLLPPPPPPPPSFFSAFGAAGRARAAAVATLRPSKEKSKSSASVASAGDGAADADDECDGDDEDCTTSEESDGESEHSASSGALAAMVPAAPVAAIVPTTAAVPAVAAASTVVLASACAPAPMASTLLLPGPKSVSQAAPPASTVALKVELPPPPPAPPSMPMPPTAAPAPVAFLAPGAAAAMPEGLKRSLSDVVRVPRVRKRQRMLLPILSQPREVLYECAGCKEMYTAQIACNPWWAVFQQDCPRCLRKQVPRVDITHTTNNVDNHTAILSACAEEDDDSESDYSSEEETAGGGEDSDFEDEARRPKLSPDQAAKLLVMMTHARSCPGRHSNPHHQEVCRSTKFLMLHIRDCSGSSADGAPCPQPWCRPCKALLLHLVNCPEPAACEICNPLDLPPPLRQLRQLNERVCGGLLPPPAFALVAAAGGILPPAPMGYSQHGHVGDYYGTHMHGHGHGGMIAAGGCGHSIAHGGVVGGCAAVGPAAVAVGGASH